MLYLLIKTALHPLHFTSFRVLSKYFLIGDPLTKEQEIALSNRTRLFMKSGRKKRTGLFGTVKGGRNGKKGGKVGSTSASASGDSDSFGVVGKKNQGGSGTAKFLRGSKKKKSVVG